jgi:hypothetical protein
MMKDTCSQFSAISYLTTPELFDSKYTVVEDLFMKYKEVDSSELGFGFPKYSQEIVTQKDLFIHLCGLSLIFIFRVLTLFIKNGIRFNATRKVYYLKRAIAVLWIRFLTLQNDQTSQSSIEWYILMGCGIFEVMSLFDIFQNTEIPFLSKNNQIVQQENGVVRYSDEEHEFIDTFNFFDFVTLSLNALFIYYAVVPLLSESMDVYNEEWRIY